jgi:hypothetical protein
MKKIKAGLYYRHAVCVSVNPSLTTFVCLNQSLLNLARISQNEQVKRDEMGKERSTHLLRRGMHTGFWWKSQKERGH